MKKTFIIPEVEVNQVDLADIIATSGSGGCVGYCESDGCGNKLPDL